MSDTLFVDRHPELQRELAEQQRLQAWRYGRFRALGASPDEATRLERMGADHHELERLLAAGCPPSLAVDILV